MVSLNQPVAGAGMDLGAVFARAQIRTVARCMADPDERWCGLAAQVLFTQQSNRPADAVSQPLVVKHELATGTCLKIRSA